MPGLNEVALVTGAAGALGAEVARTLTERGDRVVLVDSEAARPRLEKLAATLAGSCVVAGDITSDAVWDEALPRIARELGGAPSLAALVAGAWRGGKPLHAGGGDDDTWNTMMRANLETVHRSLVRLLPAMVERKHGAVVVIGSRAALHPGTSAGAAAYAASKAAVVALAGAVAAEVLEFGVRVNALLPSTMDTPANRAAMPSADPSRWVSLASAAGAVAFLLSDAARDISGVALPIDGRS